MNAVEQVRSYQTASKVSAVVNLFKRKFPRAGVDLKPWYNPAEIWELLDPHSIDLCFNFPGISRMMQARSILLLIRFHPEEQERAIGIDALGYNYRGQCWQFSTIADWTFRGEPVPIPDGRAEFKDFCCQVLQLFNSVPTGDAP
ncbi:MAG: hypothetical protein ACK4QL_06185 [Pseudanabaenaceae cyanobacterium]